MIKIIYLNITHIRFFDKTLDIKKCQWEKLFLDNKFKIRNNWSNSFLIDEHLTTFSNIKIKGDNDIPDGKYILIRDKGDIKNLNYRNKNNKKYNDKYWIFSILEILKITNTNSRNIVKIKETNIWNYFNIHSKKRFSKMDLVNWKKSKQILIINNLKENKNESKSRNNVY